MLRRAAATAALVATSLVTALAGPALAAVNGPDVSHYQHPNGAAITWSSVKASGQSFVFHKATEGTDYRDPTFTTDWAAAKKVGLIVGAYHFAQPSTVGGSAVAQARAFVSYAGNTRHAGELAPVLDLEVTGGLTPPQLIAWTKTWLTTAQQLTGRVPILYSYPSFWSSAMAGTTAFSSYPLWAACYCSGPSTFGGAWTHWTFWQWTDSSAVSGIPGTNDANKFNGSLAQLQALAFHAPVPVPVVTDLTGAAPSSVLRRVPFTLSGLLRTATGTPLATQSVLVYSRVAGTQRWFPAGTVTTSSTGAWTVQLTAPMRVQLRALFLGSSTAQSTVSRTITVGVTDPATSSSAAH